MARRKPPKYKKPKKIATVKIKGGSKRSAGAAGNKMKALMNKYIAKRAK